MLPATSFTRRTCGFALAALCLLPTPAAASPIVRPWPQGKPTPRLVLHDMDGKRWDLHRLRGRAVVLNFWATWCEPCRSEMPSLELLATRHADDPVTVLTVNHQEGLLAIRRFVDQLGMTLPVLRDVDGTATGAWTPRMFPTTVLVDAQGRPRVSVLGECDWTGPLARGLMRDLLAAPPRR